MTRYFIKVGARDKLLQKAKDGGGFQPIEVLVTGNYELAVTEPERPYWVEIYPSWEEKTFHVNGFEVGALTGLLMQADQRTRLALDGVWKQLMVIRKVIEDEAGVTKEILPGGMVRTKDRDGNVFTREPLPGEVEGN